MLTTSTPCHKNMPTYFFSVLVKYEPTLINIGRRVLEPHILGKVWETRSDRLSRQSSPYMQILVNHWIATNTTLIYCFRNRQTCSKSHHLYIAWSKCLPPVRTQAHRRWRHVVYTARSMNSVIQICPVVLDASFQFVDSRHLGTRWTFRSYSVKMMWLITRLTIFRQLLVMCVAIQWFIKMYITPLTAQ